MSEEPPVAGEYVTVAADYVNQVCAGTMEHMDVFIERLMERFQIDPDDVDLSICYAWKDDLEEVAELCGVSELIDGCAFDRTTISVYIPHEHELVHNVARLIGKPPAFFDEGIAVAHEGYEGLLNKRHSPTEQTPIDFMVMSLDELAQGDGYEVAGRFTGYLMAVHGMDAYLRLYRSLKNDADLARIDEAYQDALGVTLDESVAEYLDTWIYCWSDPLLSECNAPEVAWDGELLEYEEEVDCDKGDAIGPYESLTALTRTVLHRTITIEEEAMYELRLAGDTQESTGVPDVGPLGRFPEHGVSLYGCNTCGYGYMETIAGGTPRITRLKPGKYSLRLHGRRFEPGPVAFTLKKVE